MKERGVLFFGFALSGFVAGRAAASASKPRRSQASVAWGCP